MRIDDGSSPLYRAEPILSGGRTESSPTPERPFSDVLQQLLTPNPSQILSLQTTHLQIHLALGHPSGELQEEALAESQEDLQQESYADLQEDREDAYIEDLIENQEEMEDLIDQWEERGEIYEDLKTEKKEQGEEIRKEERLDDVDESPEQLHLHDDSAQDKPKDERPAFIELEKKHGPAAVPQGQEPLQERDLTYQEIQMLMETTLHSKNRLKNRVRDVLQSLLSALAQGQRFLLDQHRLAGLEFAEWQEITQLFPPRFYGGLVKQAMLLGGNPALNNLYLTLQNLAHQTPPTPAEMDFWQALWEPALGEWPLLAHNWWHQQPLLIEPQSLMYMLEILQHRNLLPTGAIGPTLSLALNHQHHPESQAHLFRLTQKWLHNCPMSAEDLDFFAEKIYERCYPQELSDRSQTMAHLRRVLKGESLNEADLLQLLQGCTQGVLSYLPYAYLPPSLQELQDYVQRDLFGKEEAVLHLLLDSDHPQEP